MGKIKRERTYLKRNGSLLPSNNEKIVLTATQLENLITRVRMKQMEEDGLYRKQIQKQLNYNHNTIIKWGKISFDNPRAFVEGVRKGGPEVSRNIEKVVLRKRTNKIFSSRKAGLQLCISHTTVKNILNNAELKWKVRRTATKLTADHKKARLQFCEQYKDQNLGDRAEYCNTFHYTLFRHHYLECV